MMMYFISFSDIWLRNNLQILDDSRIGIVPVDWFSCIFNRPLDDASLC